MFVLMWLSRGWRGAGFKTELLKDKDGRMVRVRPHSCAIRSPLGSSIGQQEARCHLSCPASAERLDCFGSLMTILSATPSWHFRPKIVILHRFVVHVAL